MAYKRVSNLRISRTPERSKSYIDAPNSQPGQSQPATLARRPKLRAEVLIPADSPISQVEIEVIAALLDDWDSLMAESDKE